MSFFRNYGILPYFWVHEINNFAQKLSLRNVEMIKITKYVHFRKIILFVKHPTLGCFNSVKLEKSKFLKFFLIFLKFSRLLLRVTIFLLRNRITRTSKKMLQIKFYCIQSTHPFHSDGFELTYVPKPAATQLYAQFGRSARVGPA